MKIVRNHESAQHKRTSHTARARNRDAVRHSPVEFICIDGEGFTDEHGIHRYALLGVGDCQVENPMGLSFPEILAFLYSQFRQGGYAYTGFFLGYDFTQWLKSLPEYKARRLLDTGERAKRQRRVGHRGERLETQVFFPVDHGGWEFDLLGSKRFKLRPQGESRWMYVCDAGGFFQKSFLKVIDPKEWSDPVVSQEDYDDIAAGKQRRSTAVLDDATRRYNRLENRALATVLHELDSGLRELGIHLAPKQWFGPGQAAQEWLRGRAPERPALLEAVPGWYLDAARQSYYGGWFEIMAHGLVSGVTWEYDINSAYPRVIRDLPCLLHGRYARVRGNRGPDDTGNLSLVRAAVSSPGTIRPGEHYNIGAALHRAPDGTITRPTATEGWYWEDELDAARRAGCITRYEVQDRLEYVPCDCPAPFRQVQDIYDTRLRVGKKTPLGIACKLVPNSLYGKFAQSVGNPRYGNPVYASRITSQCRTMILNAISTHPRGQAAVRMVATDGVYFDSPHLSLDTGTGLGQWEESRRQNMTLFKPGVYWDDQVRHLIAAGEAPVFKTRGVSARNFSRELAGIDHQFRELERKHVIPETFPEVTFGLDFSMVTAVQALARGKWETAGTVSKDVRVRQSSNPYAKRTAPYWDGDILKSRPPVNYPHQPSVPYAKRFGMEDPWSQETEESHGILPEGVPTSIWKEMLSGE